MEAPTGTIILWKSGAIPTGWIAYAAANYRFLRGAAAGESAGTLGGSDTHFHTPGAVQSAGSHEHGSTPFSYGNASGSNSDITGGTGINISRSGHGHNGSFSLGAGGAHVHNRASESTGSASNLPPYKTAIWIIKL